MSQCDTSGNKVVHLTVEFGPNYLSGVEYNCKMKGTWVRSVSLGR